MNEPLEISTLGGLSIHCAGQPVTGFDSRKVEALLVYVACTGRPQTRDVLADLLWDDLPQTRALGNLRVALHSLRKQLDRYVTITRDAVALNPEATIWLDVAEFEEKLRAGRIEEAVALYQGDFLQGFYVRGARRFEDWAIVECERLRQLALDALSELVTRQLEAGTYKNGIVHARRLVQLDPYLEDAHRQLMRLLAFGGQRGAALVQYDTCRQVLKEELGVEPTAETTALYEQIQAGELEIPTPSEQAVSHREIPLRSPAFLEAKTEREIAERPVFVTRERELERLNGFLEAALAGEGRVVFVTGGPGRGKTALLGEFVRRGMDEHPGLLVASGNCNAYAGVGDPYLPFREVMGMLTGDVESRWAAGAISQDHARRLWDIVPLAMQVLLACGTSLLDTFVPTAALLSRAAVAKPADSDRLGQLRELTEQGKVSADNLEQSHLFEQYTNVLRALAARHPLLLVLDDLQWMDTASISLLFHLGRRLAHAGSRVLIACAYRPEEVALGRDGQRHPLEKLLAESKRLFGDVWVNLGRTEEAEGRRFVDAFLDTEPNRLDVAFRRALFHHTRGHPLFTIELLRAMQDRGDLVQDKEGQWVQRATLDWETLPPRVEGVIEERIGRLDPELREILTVASVEGEDFTAQVLAQVLEIGERQLLQKLSRELAKRHRLVREQGELTVDHLRLSRYRFAHALFQQYLYYSLGEGERRLLHREIGAVLENLYQGHLEEIAVELTRHYVGDVERERLYSRIAGQQAAVRFANEQAVVYLSRALNLTPEAHYLQRYELLLTREKVYDLLGERKAQRQDLEILAGLAETLNSNRKRTQVALRHVSYFEVMSDYEAALVAVQQALEYAAQTPELTDDTAGHIAWGKILIRQGTFEEARTSLTHALNLARVTNDNHAEAQSLHQLGHVYLLQGDYPTARDHFQKALKIYRVIGYPQNEADSLNVLGLVHGELGDYSAAQDYYRQALHIHNATGDQRGQTIVLNNLGIVYCDLGEFEAAQDYHKQALDMCLAISDRWGEATSLTNLGLVHLGLGDAEAARKYCERALASHREIGDRRGEGYSLTYLGHALTSLGELQAATKAYQEAVRLRRELGQYSLLIDDWAGLANVAIAQGHLDRALEQIEDILAWIEANGLEGIEYPLRVYLTCYRVLQVNQDPRAEEVLGTAYRSLQERAAGITDKALRRSFLENVAAHREIVAAWEEGHTEGRR